MLSMDYQFSRSFADQADKNDELRHFRTEFLIPQKNQEPVIYFTGNSLGLQSKKVKKLVEEELDDWAAYGVEGHLHSRRPWLNYHEFFTESLANLAGAKSSEVVAMNGLTVNLHLLMASFFQPRGRRTKIICEGKAFPSDQYAMASQLRFHGLDPKEHLIEIEPQNGLLDEQEIIDTIDQHRDDLALVMLGGVNYYSGQLLNMERITEAGQRAGAKVGWDLAHGMGNVPLELHRWGADFAAWCSYKYLNGGPGAVSGVFIHERHHGKKEIARFEGWWGHRKEDRFAMPPVFEPMPTAEAWQLSNAPVLSMTPLLASLELFDQAGMARLHQKARQLTGYLEFVIHSLRSETGMDLQIVTPEDPGERGCQLSVIIPKRGREIFEFLSEAGVIADWREPDVIRMAPVPLYNNFSDVFRFGSILRKAINAE
mgnify:CR=1 FL=1